MGHLLFAKFLLSFAVTLYNEDRATFFAYNHIVRKIAWSKHDLNARDFYIKTKKCLIF